MRIIRDYQPKIKRFACHVIERWGILVILILVSLSSFALGRLSIIWGDRSDIKISQENKAEKPAGQYPGGAVVGSHKTGLYDAPWCTGAGESDGKWFHSEQSALENGLQPDPTCKGMGD